MMAGDKWGLEEKKEWEERVSMDALLATKDVGGGPEDGGGMTKIADG